MTRTERNTDYRENFSRYVLELVRFPDELLQKKLDLVQMQIALAVKNRDEEVYETLSLWEKHIIEARILRDEMEVKPEFVDEMEAVTASVETVLHRDEPEPDTHDAPPEIRQLRKRPVQGSSDGQMNLF